MATNTILIDANNILWRAIHTQPPVVGDEIRLHACATFLGMIAKYSKRYHGARLAVCWDDVANGPAARRRIFPGYKDRKYDPILKRSADIQRTAAQVMLKWCGVQQYYSPEWEADDTIAGLIYRRSGEGPFAVVSNDRDLLQLVSYDVTIACPQNGGDLKLVTPLTFLEKYGFPCEKWLEYRTLTGDKGDCVPGIPGIAEVRATAIIKHFKFAEEAVKSAQGIGVPWPAGLPNKTKQLLAAGSAQVEMARKLIKLNPHMRIEGLSPNRDRGLAYSTASACGFQRFIDYDIEHMLGVDG